MHDALPPSLTFREDRPARWRGGLIVASPHSGRDYPDWFLAESQLGAHELRSSEDAFVDHLAAPARDHGAVVLTARWPRALVDLNRDGDEFDPQVVAGTPARGVSRRAESGLGVIPRVVARGRLIRRAPLPMAEAQARVARFWQPYHERLDSLMAEARARFGRAVLVDLHSMPREATSHLSRPLPDAVVGDLCGRSAASDISAAVAGALSGAGLRLRMNVPFAGAYILTRHGRPAEGRHAVQVELDRALYMNEAQILPHEGMARLTAQMGRFFAALADALDPAAGDLADSIAAE